MVKKIYIFLFLLFSLFKLGAQTCTIVTSSNIVCINNALNFSATYTAGLTPSTDAWNFGNGVTNTQPNPTYNYPIIGTFTPTLTIVFTNNSQCIITGNPIQVVALPIADFRILSNIKQCFKGNLVCIKDTSRAGTSGSKIAKHTFLWGDGDFDTTVNFTDTICHNYKNIAGGLYSLILEVTDFNGCLTRLEKNNAITILPKMDLIAFDSYSTRCDTTIQTFQNTSAIPFSKVKKFVWDFGDGNIDSSNTKWTIFNHSYALPDLYYPSLYVIDIDNCSETFIRYIGVNKKVFDNKITITSVNKCYSKQNFIFSYKDAVYGDKIFWGIRNSEGELMDSVFNFRYVKDYKTDSIRLFNCGLYHVSMYAFYGSNCKIRIDTTIEIYGPNAIIANLDVRPINEFQCASNDTVFFRVPPPEISCFYQNVTNWLWDFDDGFAPPCTTDTKRGINVGINCRYSKDSTQVKHKYNQVNPSCYNVKLILKDTLKNCSDIDSSLVIINSPNAKPDLPNRRGLYYNTFPPGKNGPPKHCINNAFVFKFEETLPACGREKIWINLDSAAGKDNWINIKVDSNFLDTFYNNVADDKGWVTVGLIIKNGNCYDTAWYHHMFQILKLKPMFEIKVADKCKPYHVTLTMVDSIQDSLVSATFDVRPCLFNANQFHDVQNFSLTDSIIHQRNYVFNSSGCRTIIVTLTNRHGCSLSYEYTINLGFGKTTDNDTIVYCLKDAVPFEDNFEYYSGYTGNWKKFERAAANLEKIWWNFGDTTDYEFYGIMPKHKYKTVGNFKISLVVQDSNGCKDTLINFRNINVVDINAAIAPISDNLICAPKVVRFHDASQVNDSLPNYYVKQKIITWHWEFGDSKTISLEQNPVHDYSTNDSFKVKLVVTSNYGCIDSITLPVVIKGPTPKYSFLSGDTIGCSPVKFKMNNTTGVQLQSWQWTINGPENFIVSTDKDSNTNFSLVKAGRYRVLLLGTDSLVNEITGQTVYCTSVFPDTLNPNAKPVYITVFDNPLVQLFGPDTVCANDVFTIFAKADTMYSYFLWQASNGFNLPLKPRTDSVFNYSFKDSGSYIIQLIPTPKISIACIDTGIHAIYVRNIKADFDINESRSPIDSFINKSISATGYFWDFGQPSSGINNFSNLQNPTHDYKNLVDSFKVCLVAQNAGACFDTICKIIVPTARLLKIPNVFTPNNDGINDAFDIEILGQTFYEIKIYNRWGNKVFEGNADGKGNDGINWNGKTDNDGNQNTDGVYFYLFKYKFNDKESEKTVHGSITLIRQ